MTYEPTRPEYNPAAAAALARRITRARLAAALARLQSLPAAQDWDRLSRADRLAILREIRATRAALDAPHLRED